MTEWDILDRLSDRQVLALTAMGEARGDNQDGSSLEERVAVMHVVRNRLRRPERFGRSYKAVCLQRLQFSCWNVQDPNRAVLLHLGLLLIGGQDTKDPVMTETLFLADGVMSGVLLDRTGWATHYYSPAAMQPAGARPAWTRGVNGQPDPAPVARVGSQVFYRNV